MKKTLAIFVASAAAALALVSCQKENNAPASLEKTVNFTANTVETKTAFTTPSGTSYPVEWTENDTKVKVSLNYASPKDADVTPNGSTAKFSVSITDDESGNYKFFAMSPASAHKGLTGTSGTTVYNSWYIYIPTVQTPLVNSVDEAAQILVAKSTATTTFPTTDVELTFNHITAYGLLSFTNLALTGTEKVESVKLTAQDNWVGGWYYYLEDNGTQSAGEVSPHGSTPEKALTIYTDKTSDIWFACAPVDLSTKTIEVVVTSDAGYNYTKVITIPSGKSFQSGKIAKIDVDMSTATKTTAAIYTLTPFTGGSNGYATESSDLDCGGIKWNVTGNTTLTPWRIGGKNLDNVARPLYSTTPIEGNVKQIIISHGNNNGLTVNSMKVYVCSTAAGAAAAVPSDVVASFTPTFAANNDVTIDKTDATSWANCYYRFEYYLTVGGSNKYLEFKGAVFN